MDFQIKIADNDITEQDLQYMKDMILKVKLNPELMNKKLNLISSPYHMSAKALSMKLESSNNAHSDTSPDCCQQFSISSPDSKHNDCTEALDTEIAEMKQMVHEMRQNPSLIYAKFHLPWAITGRMSERTCPDCEIQLKQTKDFSLPKLPLPHDANTPATRESAANYRIHVRLFTDSSKKSRMF